LADVGIAPEDIVRIVGTHHHVDHFGTSQPLRELTHAEVYLHPLEAERATLMGHVGSMDSTDYLPRQGVPPAAPDPQPPPPRPFFRHLVPPRAARPPPRRRGRAAARRRPLARGRVDAGAHAGPLLPRPQAGPHPLRRRSPAAEDHPARRPLAERPREPAR